MEEIIEEDKLDEYYNYLEATEMKGNSNFFKANLELERIHHKAVLDYFNHELNSYRPYK